MTKRTFEVECVGLDDFGRGIIRLENTTAFVDDLLPGEKAIVSTYFSYGKLKEAKLDKRLTTSPDRAKPMCAYYPKCGGCQLMHLNYEKQLEYKTKKVKDLLHKFAKIDFEVSPCLGVEKPTRFRNKVQKPIRIHEKKKIPLAGFYEKSTHKLVPVKDCLVESELSNKITNILLDLFLQYNVYPYDEDEQYGIIRHVLIKTSSDEKQALVTLVVTTDHFKGKMEIARILMKKVKEVRGVVLNINSRKTNVILGEKEVRLAGYSRIGDQIFDKTFLISSQSFYQTNSKQIETLYGKAIEYAELKKDDVLLDAYCGTGTIGLSCADHVKEVVGVEIVASAVHDAITNAKINKITNAHFIKGDCTEFLMNTDKRFDVIVMDPPRRGSTPDFLDAVKRIAPSRLVYVSCDPVTLARDLALLKDTYAIKAVQPVDMFPHSLHVETVVLLSRKNA